MHTEFGRRNPGRPEIRGRSVSLALFALAGAAAASAVSRAPGQQPSNADVMRFTDAQGFLRPMRDAEDWAVRRREILHNMELVMGALPDRSDPPPLELQFHKSENRDRHELHWISLLSEPTDRIHALLYVPKDISPGERRPAVLALHPTHAIGKLVTDGRSEGTNRAYARELADRGYVVIAPDYPSFGEETGYDFSADRYVSGTMKGIWNHMRCIDLLLVREDVDPERIAAIGHSLGGHNAMFVAVFDPRVRVIVASCGWNAFHHYYGGDLKGWSSDRYMPRILERYGADPALMPFDFYEVVAALAPRPFFSNSPLHDANFEVEGVRLVIEEAGKVWRLLGAPDLLQIRHPDAEHDFPDAERFEAYRFIDEAMGFTPTE